MKEIIIYAPATVANVVCGFDVLGFALNEPKDELVLRILPEPVVRIINKTAYNLPTDPLQNVSGVALLELMKALKEPVGFEIEFIHKIKPGSGIGSSAASAAGVVVGANQLLNSLFTKEELVRFAMKGEKLASGAEHADNIAPCIYGGITLVRSNHPLDIISLNVPDFFVSIVHPEIELKTSDARGILKQKVLLKDAVQQWANIAGLVAGFMKNDHALISRSLEDVIVEPVRSILIPEFNKIKNLSIEAGALGGGISGSGPSMFMFSSTEAIAKKVETVFAEVYTQAGINFKTYLTTINTAGVKCLLPENIHS